MSKVKIILAAAALMLAVLVVIVAIMKPSVGFHTELAVTAGNGGWTESGEANASLNASEQEGASPKTAAASAAADSQSALPAVPGGLGDQVEQYKDWPDYGGDPAPDDAATVRAQGISRYGKLEIASMPGEQYMPNGAATRYYGAYTVSYIDAGGSRHQLPELGNPGGLALHQLKDKPQRMRVIEMDGFDLVLFEPRNSRYSQAYDHGIRSVYAYAITAEEEAIPLAFVYNRQGAGLQRTDVIQVNVNGPIQRDGSRLSVQSTIEDGRYELAWTPNLQERTLSATAVVDRVKEYAELTVITSRAAQWIEQALGELESDFPEGKLSEEKLRGLFSDEAWRNPGFQYLRKDFARMEQAGNSSRAFAWEPINAAYLSPDKIRFTFTINLWYAIGLTGELDVLLKKTSDEWKIADLGMLETEKIAGDGVPQAYNGLLIEDPLTGL